MRAGWVPEFVDGDSGGGLGARGFSWSAALAAWTRAALDQAWYFDEAAGRECQSRLVAGKPDAWEDARAEMSAETKRMTGRRPPPASRRDGTQRSDHRLAYLDNLKVLLVVGVIAVHTAIIYGVDGSFYLEDYDSMVDVSVGLLTIFTGVGFLFGLGAFFLIAGRLSGPSLDRKGPRRFVRDRLLRLGIPVLFYVALIAPVMEYVKYRDEGGTDGFLTIAGDQLSDPAPVRPGFSRHCSSSRSPTRCCARCGRAPADLAAAAARAPGRRGGGDRAPLLRDPPRLPVRRGALPHPVRALPAVRDPVRPRLCRRAARLARDAHPGASPSLRRSR